jgi:AcrR family transcriptional regulator
MSARGDQTKELLLDEAETLYGERGVAGVSLREIRLAAGARNTAAMQFHFGDRDGVIDALTARHMPRIGQIQQALYDDAEAEGRLQEPRTLVEILVRPSADYLMRGPRERAWVKIMADLGALPDLHLKEMAVVTPDAGLRAGAALYQLLESAVPAKLARERIIMMAQMSVHACADYARLLDEGTEIRPHLDVESFTNNLIDMLFGALFAPARPDRVNWG